MQRRGPAIVIAVAAIVLALVAVFLTSRKPAAPSGQLVTAGPLPGGPHAMPAGAASPADNGNWEMPGKDYASSRFSALSEITPANVSKLGLAFTFSTATTHGYEAPPLVVGSTMYLITPFPNYLYALDLAKGGALKWVFKPQPLAASQGVACCDTVNRGAVYDNGRIFFNTLDGQTIAVDANSGQQVWRTQLGNIEKGETVTMAPLVAAGKVYVGSSGGEMGVRGWIAALDEGSGKVAWKAFNTGPDKDVLIGSRFKPFYASDQGKDLGVKSWPPEAWKIGGGNVWGWISYDPETNTIFYGTGNPGPWNPDQRPGDNKFTTGLFARDASTGEALWYYQSSPHDLFDHDDVNEIILTDMPWGNGGKRPVLLHPGRNGFFYVMDRRTGQVLSATPYGYINSAKGVDLKSGRMIPVAEKEPKQGRVTRNICPAAPGAKDWNPAAFSPVTGLVYIPHINLCMDEGPMQANYISGTPYVGADVKMYAGPGGNRGVFTAWDPVHNRKVWEIKEDLPLWSPALATGGNVVFYGTMDGFFKAIDGRTGKPLWQFKAGSGIIGQPISYRGPDGHQYIAVVAGVGGWSGAIVAGQLDPGDPTAALGFVNAMKDLPNKTTAGGMLYVFRLPG